jgi:hypothetical protein
MVRRRLTQRRVMNARGTRRAQRIISAPQHVNPLPW